MLLKRKDNYENLQSIREEIFKNNCWLSYDNMHDGQSEKRQNLEWLNEELHMQLGYLISQWNENVCNRLVQRVEDLQPYFSNCIEDPDPNIASMGRQGLEIISDAQLQITRMKN